MRKLLVVFFLFVFVLGGRVDAAGLSIEDFTDYSKSQYWSSAVKWAYEEGIMMGYAADRKIKPNIELTEAQYLAMYFRLFVPEQATAAALTSKDHWATPHYQLAQKYKLNVSTYERSAEWNKPIRRGDTARLLAEGLSGKEMTEPEAVQWLYDQKLSVGFTDKNGYAPMTYSSYKPDEKLTRAQGVVFFHRLLDSKLHEENLKIVDRNPYQASANEIQLNDLKANIESRLGSPKRIATNKDGLELATYFNAGYEGSFMVIGYDKYNQASLIYTNTPPFKIAKDGKPVTLNHASIASTFGQPGVTNSTSSKRFYVGDEKVTFYYEASNSQLPVRALKIEKQSWERRTLPADQFAAENYLILDITNSYRKKFGLKPLIWDGKIAGTAFKHSKDMAINSYFAHNSLNGSSPFDRMRKDGIVYSYAGENIARGQTSGIDATEAWLNSQGHRENILNKNFTKLGVGTYYSDTHTPHYTQNFYTPR